MSAAWSPLQRETLEAMGLPVYRAVGIAACGGLPDDPLIDALLRAAARNRETGDATRLAKLWPPVHVLRKDPRAKRALWPQLRALRRPSA